MKKLLLVLCSFLLTAPVSFSKGESPGLAIEPVHYTNKSPFLLEGKAEAGSEIEIHGEGIVFKVGDEGSFRVELKVDEGINLFAITASKNGVSSTKGFMVEMDTTPPEVTLLIDHFPAHNTRQYITTSDATECTVAGFAETGCQIVVDNTHFVNENIQFEAKFSLPKAPSKSDHLLTISDKFGNEIQFVIRISNLHRRKIIVQAEKSEISIDGEKVDMSSPAILVGEMTIMIPIRTLACDVFQGRLAYDNETKKAKIEFDDNTLIFEVGKNQVLYNGSKYINFGSSAFIKDNRLYVPIDVLNRIFHYNLRFDHIEKSVEYYIDIHS